MRQHRTSRPAATHGERPLWLFLAEPGLGPLLLRELKFRDTVGQKTQAAKLHLRNYDVLVIPDAAMLDRKASPRLALHVLVCPVFGRTQIGTRQLEFLAQICAREKTDGLIASIAGETFSRPDFVPWIRRELAKGHVRLDAKGPQRPVWLIAVDEKFYFGFSRYNHHDAMSRASAAEREGSLPATIAAAMAFAAKLGDAEVAWDPCAGTGTVLGEVAALAPNATLVGSDIDGTALADARKRLPRGRTVLTRGDATELDPGCRDISLTISNLPFGKRFKSESGNLALYTEILRKGLSHSAPGWRALLLTSDGEALNQAVSDIGNLAMNEVARIKVRGVDAGMFHVERSA